MRFRTRLTIRLSFLLCLTLGGGAVAAQTVNCSGVATWNASTVYNPGDRMVYQNRLYEALVPIWNAPPNYCASCGWYRDLGMCGGSNTAPTVTLTAPASGSTHTPGSTITVSASASDADGQVSKVEFFQGAVSLGTDTSSPYSVSWANVPAGNYTLKAVATDNAGASATSGTVSITVSGGGDTIAPSVPSNLASPSQTGTSISLSWSASTDNAGGSGVAGYDVYRNSSLVGASTSTSFTDSGLTPATSYSYRVRARDNAGNASAQSGAITASTTSAACTTVPPVPGNLRSTGVTSSSINLAWNAVSAGANCTVRYRLFRGGSQIAETASTSATAGGLAADTVYTFTIQAIDEAGQSAQSAPITVRTSPISNGAKKVIGYFTQWGIYGRNYIVRNIDTSDSAARLTHINYAFGNVRNNRCEVGVVQPSDPNTGAGGDAFADYTKAFGAAQSVDGVADTWDQKLRGNWNQLKKLKAKYPNLKVMISLGGWTWSRGFSSAARPENRQAFVASCIDAYIRGNLPVTDGAGGAGAAAGVFDGIDLDWEYPAACGLQCGSPEDSANFTALLAEFRRQLDAVRPGLLLSIAAGAGIDKIRVTDPGQYHQYLDFINVMTYDFHGAWESTTNHHSALYGSPADPSTGDVRSYNSHDALQAFISRGVPASKLHLGIGFYGRGWTNVPNSNNGLYRNGSAAPGTYEAGIEDYKVLKNLGWPGHNDATAKAHWIFNGSTFWSFDDPPLVFEKMQYVKNQGLGGAFFWEFSGDDAQGSLAKAIKDGLQ
ncbi:glycosyl hydrolase family 18 protein [Tahibacter amnicola]|uniref:glycosyl hydrolase family 18 protein n=1 Tax=Tahibacter amnicola TaxID=2976241 RepID=UPI0031BA1BB7